MRKNLFLAVTALLFLSGCYPQSPEELDRLMKEDPAFRQTIEARDRARAGIRLIKNDLLARKRALDIQIGKLRDEYDAYAKGQYKKIEQYRAAILAAHQAMQREAELLSASADSKEKELSSYQKTLADFNKVLREGKGITFTKEEKKNFEERILLLSEKMRPLTDEIRELKLQLGLKKRKMAFVQ